MSSITRVSLRLLLSAGVLFATPVFAADAAVKMPDIRCGGGGGELRPAVDKAAREAWQLRGQGKVNESLAKLEEGMAAVDKLTPYEACYLKSMRGHIRSGT